MSIKYKHAESNGWFYKIDTNTNERISFPKRHKYYNEMQKWVDNGNEIEPIYTEDELIEKQEQENTQALEIQKKVCKNLLDISEIHVSNDPPYPDDIEEWKNARKEWRKILKSDTLQEIYPKPFGE